MRWPLRLQLPGLRRMSLRSRHSAPESVKKDYKLNKDSRRWFTFQSTYACCTRENSRASEEVEQLESVQLVLFHFAWTAIMQLLLVSMRSACKYLSLRLNVGCFNVFVQISAYVSRACDNKLTACKTHLNKSTPAAPHNTIFNT